MDKEYLQDYEQKEHSEYERLVVKRIREGRFSFEKDRYPPDERFVNLQKPVAVVSYGAANVSNLWAQVPFCGSLILFLVPAPKPEFEQIYFKVSEIPKIIDFIKETGRLQVALSAGAHLYEGLDHLDPFFKELNPPVYPVAPISIFGNEKEVQKVTDTFYTLGRVGYLDFLRNRFLQYGSRIFPQFLGTNLAIYMTLKLGRYIVVEDIEKLMIDNPEKALSLFVVCRKFIVDPLRDLRSNLKNFTLDEIRKSQALPLVYQPQEIRFPCEIGKSLLRKLTFAPQGLRACNELIDHYDAYDLRKALESLNDGIVTNHPDVVNKNAEDLSEILDNVWNDKTISKRVENIKIGVPISIAAIGSVAGGLIGGPAGVGTGGFLAGLGFKVAEKAVEKFFGVKGEGLSEKLAKLRAKSYQANVYDFKKKYKAKIAHP